jgi:hypothetical protein
MNRVLLASEVFYWFLFAVPWLSIDDAAECGNLGRS